MGKKKVEEIVQAVMADEIAPIAEEPVVIVEEPIIENIVEPVIEDDVLIEEQPAIKKPMLPVGAEVKVVPGAKYTSGIEVPDSILASKLYVRKVNGNEYFVGLQKTGRILGALKAEDVVEYTAPVISKNIIKPYKVLITAEKVDIKSRPDNNAKTLKTIVYDSLFTVVDEKDGWAHLKIGGWIPLDTVIKL